MAGEPEEPIDMDEILEECLRLKQPPGAKYVSTLICVENDGSRRIAPSDV